jgi:hypothetical protein
MIIDGKIRDIDFCISDIVKALNDAGLSTIASCCGHSKIDAIICLTDGRRLVITRNDVL